MSTSRTTTMTSPAEPPSSPAQRRLNEVEGPTVSPLLEKLLKSPQSPGTYGCQREVYHPLSENAEKLAILYYDSAESEDECDKRSAARSSTRKHGLKARLEDELCNTGPTARKSISRVSPRENREIEVAFSTPNPQRGVSSGDNEATATSEMLPTTSPRWFPLPDSLEGSSLRSYETSPTILPQHSPRLGFPSAGARAGMAGKGNAVADAEAITSRLEILHIKAAEYSEAITRPESNRQLARELDALFTKENRFNPKEAALLEAEYQQKIRAVYDRRVAEEHRLLELERLELERQAAEKAAEEYRLREAAEELKKALEKKRQEEAAKARAEQEKKEAEAKKAAEDKAREEREAQEKAQKQQADAAAAVTQPQSAPLQSAAPQVYGRRSFETEAANVKRVITELKGLRQLDLDYVKASGLKRIRRELVPKFGQLTGMKDQTINVRDSIKQLLDSALQVDGPSVPAANYLLQPAPPDLMVPIPFVWTVNQLAKLAMYQLLQECTSKSDAADPMGVVIAGIFADPKYCPGGRSLIDIFVARFLKWNPILLGQLGPDDTEADRERLGWKRDKDGSMESEESYGGRMQALTAGFVAIAARDFGRSSMRNPYPTFNLWHIVASLVNSPPEKLTSTHYFVVNTIVYHGAKKLCGVYGRQAKKLVEIAVGPWAARGMTKEFQGAQALQATGIYFRRQEWWNQLN